ncbi:trypsin, alkaline C-like [Bicyclus anynana]|uniref:Trypsin, alkaline C-like n=1 Tax=Bicyclus anynana TaxID=110368 RepID=A0A6J1P041_BICAN|nr:trypsin, alkaline C-like [Bicyclus anynana]
MKTIYLFLGIFVSLAFSAPSGQERIVGGSITTINNYPFAVSLQLTRNNVNFNHQCGGTILNNRSMVSAAHCWVNNPVASRYRCRAGSTTKSSGGWSHNVAQLFGHPHYSPRNHDNDIGVVRVATAFQLGAATVRAGNIARSNHNVPENRDVIAIGWGFISTNGPLSEQLRHVVLRTVNQARCNRDFGGSITANMLCANWHDGRRSICFGDSGTGLIMNNVVIGISSFIGWDGCGSTRFPAVFARISRYEAWIRNHA